MAQNGGLGARAWISGVNLADFGQIGAILGDFGAILGDFGVIFTRIGAIFDRFAIILGFTSEIGAFLDRICAFLDEIGAILSPFRGFGAFFFGESAPKTRKKAGFGVVVFDFFDFFGRVS
jgi:hypothetical protein